MYAPRNQQSEFYQKLLPYTDPEFAKEASNYIAKCFATMREEKRFNFVQLQNIRLIINDIIDPLARKEYETVFPEIEQVTRSFFADANVTGPLIDKKIEECLKQLNLDLQKTPLTACGNFGLKLSEYIQSFLSPYEKGSLYLRINSNAQQLNDRLILPIYDKYKKIKENLIFFWTNDIEELAKCTEKQGEGLGLLEEELSSLLQDRAHAEKIKLKIQLKELKDPPSITHALEEFKKNLSPILESTFNHWVKDKLEDVRVFFQREFPSHKDITILRAMSTSVESNLSDHLKNLSSSESKKVDAGDYKSPFTKSKSTLFQKPQISSSSSTQDLINKISSILLRKTDGYLQFDKKVSTEVGMSFYSIPLTIIDSENPEIKFLDSFFKDNKLDYLRIAELSRTSYFLSMTKDNIQKLEQVVSAEPLPIRLIVPVERLT